MRFNTKHSYLIACSVIIILFGFYSSYTQGYNNHYLKVAFLDVGQGDAIYIDAPNGRQVLIDGGPDSRVLPMLSDVMPAFDRSIDMLIATHADADHIGGLPSVIDNYQISNILENGYIGETKIYKTLEEKIVEKSIKKDIAKKGMHIVLDEKENIYLDILFPDRDVSKMKTNDGSIVARLVYKDQSIMLTGDATYYTENIILKNENKDDLKSTILKLGHHGSNTSSGNSWLSVVSPVYVIISAGANSKYGHPHPDVLSRLEDFKISYLSTSREGTIVFKSDGVSFWQ
ncbi:MAG: MBL fold metallo-hydrolase [Candidatus Paceibacterota bacterium]